MQDLPIFILNGPSSSGKTTLINNLKIYFSKYNYIAYLVQNVQKDLKYLQILSEYFQEEITIKDCIVLSEFYKVFPITFSDMDESWLSLPRIFVEFYELSHLGLSFSDLNSQEEFEHKYGLVGYEIIKNKFLSLKKNFSASCIAEILCKNTFNILKESKLSNCLIINLSIPENIRIQREIDRKNRPLGLTIKQSNALTKKTEEYNEYNENFIKNLKLKSFTNTQTYFQTSIMNNYLNQKQIFENFIKNNFTIYNPDEIVQLLEFIIIQYNYIIF